MIPWDNDADIHILINSSYPHALNRDNYIDRLMRFNTEYTSPFSLEKCYQPKPPHGICTTAFKLHPGHLIGSNDLWKVRRERDVYLLNAMLTFKRVGCSSETKTSSLPLSPPSFSTPSLLRLRLCLYPTAAHGARALARVCDSRYHASSRHDGRTSTHLERMERLVQGQNAA